MLFNNEVVQEDLIKIISDNTIDWNMLNHKTVLVTGATGMLAKYVTFVMMFLNQKCNYNIKVYILVRNAEKAHDCFGNLIDNNTLTLINQDVCDNINIDYNIDYIVHAAGSCSAYSIKHDPIGIIEANSTGVKNVLELARNKNVKNVLYLSTREVYGKVSDDIQMIKESDMGVLDPLDSRSCYPESKRIGEQLFKAYHDTYGIRYNVVRMAHVYGPGMALSNDGRVMADFMNDVISGKDIVMKSTGDAVRAFCYISDAIRAVFLVLLQGNTDEAYNVSNEEEPERIRDVASQLVELDNKGLKVVYEINSDQSGYCKYARTGLDTNKIKSLGWKPEVKLKDGMLRTLHSFNR